MYSMQIRPLTPSRHAVQHCTRQDFSPSCVCKDLTGLEFSIQIGPLTPSLQIPYAMQYSTVHAKTSHRVSAKI